MSRRRVRLGRRGEELAAGALAQRGYRIVDRNWHCGVGEVDLVARRDGVWAFFEVRTRRGRRYGTPEESVTPRKRQRMIDVARTYLGQHDQTDVDWRIGFVAVEMDRSGRLLRVEVYDSIT